MSDFGPSQALSSAGPRTDAPSDPNPAERRATPRICVLEYRAWMGWWDGGRHVANAVRLLDISQGGACVESDETVRVGAEVWLCLVNEERVGDRASGVVVGVGRGTRADFRTRIEFREPCGERLYREAIGEIGPSDPAPRAS